MKRMESRYAGTCRACKSRFAAGTLIDYDRTGGRGRKAQHVDCDNPQSGAADAIEGDFYADSASAARGVSYEVRTSGGTFYRNRAGRCEDAPCCGCCTI